MAEPRERVRQCQKLSWFKDYATVPREIRKTRSSLADVLGAIPSLIPLLAASPKTHSLRSLTFLHRGVINSADNTSYEPKEKKGLLFLSFLRFLALSLLRGSSMLFLCYLSLGFFLLLVLSLFLFLWRWDMTCAATQLWRKERDEETGEALRREEEGHIIFRSAGYGCQKFWGFPHPWIWAGEIKFATMAANHSCSVLELTEDELGQ